MVILSGVWSGKSFRKNSRSGIYPGENRVNTFWRVTRRQPTNGSVTQTIVRPSLVHLRPKLRVRVPASEHVGLDEHSTSEADPVELEKPDHSTPKAAAARKRILVVDNEPASTRMVRLTLERVPDTFEVCEVNDPLRALVTARRFQPQLILLDIEMPGLDGSAVARQIRQEPALRNVPILFMTSLVTPEEAEANLYAAGSRVLAKPVTIAKLMQSVAEMLSNILANGTTAPAASPAAS